MKLEVKRCWICGRLGIGPNAVKLRPFEGRLCCNEDWRKYLDWHATRSTAVEAISYLRKAWAPSAEERRAALPRKPPQQSWRAYIEEHAGMAGEAMVIDDRRTFVYYFSRALWAWELSKW